MLYHCSLTHAALHSGSTLSDICDMLQHMTPDMSQCVQPCQGSMSVLTDLSFLHVLNTESFSFQGSPYSLPRGSPGVPEKMVSQALLFHPCPCEAGRVGMKLGEELEQCLCLPYFPNPSESVLPLLGGGGLFQSWDP